MREARPRILIVDDEPVVRELVQTVLGDAGCEAIVRGTGPEAMLAIERDGPFEALVADLRLPGLDAIGLHRQLAQARHPLADHMIVMTGDVGDASIDRFVRKTGNRLLRKPFALHKLTAAVSATLRSPMSRPARAQG